ncbi:MAG: hypothetical protein AVDCRST_MAG56-3426 [uncultured Cytophagales bacterium]|uniref:Uncharacterized protein n=1 Tax=uncultured Cytophagales bacterium TaxID=158755 RepID=A0A6J4JED5_9SPHI|nr:MAG: hypothetical protein AVDCRST_MAG56-3426 [uncultured Cytophagales bacterium]
MGLDLFGSFWGNAKKNKPYLRIYKPFTIPLKIILLPPGTTNPNPLKYAHTLITYASKYDVPDNKIPKFFVNLSCPTVKTRGYSSDYTMIMSFFATKTRRHKGSRGLFPGVFMVSW